jgi:hypothetical protein
MLRHPRGNDGFWHGIGPAIAAVMTREVYYRHFDNRRQVPLQSSSRHAAPSIGALGVVIVIAILHQLPAMS